MNIFLQKMTLRLRAVLSRLSLWQLWPILVIAVVAGLIFFPNPGLERKVAKPLDPQDPFANLQAKITADVEQTFAQYLTQFLPKGHKSIKWQYKIEALTNLRVDEGGNIVVDRVQVDVILHPDSDIKNLRDNVSDFLFVRALDGKFAGWFKSDKNRLRINVMIAPIQQTSWRAMVFWSLLLFLTLTLIFVLLWDLYRFHRINRQLTVRQLTHKARKIAPPLVTQNPEVHFSAGTCHINEIGGVASAELNQQILQMPLSQIYKLLQSIPLEQRQGLVDSLQVSASIKKHLIFHKR